MNKITKILIVIAVLLFALSSLVSATLFDLGNVEKTYDYKNTKIACSLGQLFPGQLIYWCMYPDGSMDHSWFVYQNRERDAYYTAGATSTFTFSEHK